MKLKENKIELSEKQLRKIIKEEIKKLNEKVWTDEQQKKVDKLDLKFHTYLVNNSIEPYSKEASAIWNKKGFREEFKKIFESKEINSIKNKSKFKRQYQAMKDKAKELGFKNVQDAEKAGHSEELKKAFQSVK